jgi:G:T-mismatch repair DNA endonuclease (very short patch repair protein)
MTSAKIPPHTHTHTEFFLEKNQKVCIKDNKHELVCAKLGTRKLILNISDKQNRSLFFQFQFFKQSQKAVVEIH